MKVSIYTVWMAILTLISDCIDKLRIWIHVREKGARKIPRANPLLLKWYICFSSIWISSPMWIPSVISPTLISHEISPISRYIVWYGIGCIPSWMYSNGITHASAIPVFIICIWRMDCGAGSSLIWWGESCRAANSIRRNIMLIQWFVLSSYSWEIPTIATIPWCRRCLSGLNADQNSYMKSVMIWQ